MKRVLASIFGMVTTLRNRLYDRRWLPIYRSRLPVISVGNLTAGGNAKTPLCIYLAEALKERGKRPVLLSRGYGGSVAGPTLVRRDDSYLEVGDEPLMMTRLHALTVVVARSRAQGARYIEREGLGDVIILDDGLQHRRLARDLDIITLDVSTERAQREFCRGELLPLGLFREEREAGLRRAKLMVMAARQPEARALAPQAELMALIPKEAVAVRSFVGAASINSAAGGAQLPRCAVAAFCSIANPDGFFRTIEELGYVLAARVVFPDHHRLDATKIKQLASQYGALPLVCTEKDLVKLDSASIPRLNVLKAHLEVKPKEVLLEAVMRALPPG